MGLEDQQQVLAKLFTQDSVRKDLLFDNDLLSEQGISINNKDLHDDVFAQQIYEFSDSLIKKRLGQVKQHIPGTCYILKSKLAELFNEYAKDEPTSGVKRHVHDSLMFMSYIEENYKDILFTSIDKTIFKYEGIWLRAVLADRFFYVSFFSFGVGGAVKKITLPDGGANILLGRPRICFWLKTAKGNDIIYRELSPRFWPKLLTKQYNLIIDMNSGKQ